MSLLKKLDSRFGDSTLWQFIKFNLVSLSITLLQLALARLAATTFAGLGRTIAAMAAGLVQVAVLFPLEKFVLFRKE